MLKQIQRFDPFLAIGWENLLDDVNNAHGRIDTHEEHWDEWRHDFDARMCSHAKVATWMCHTISDLQHTVEKQAEVIEELKEQIGELRAVVGYCDNYNNKHPIIIPVRGFV